MIYPPSNTAFSINYDAIISPLVAFTQRVQSYVEPPIPPTKHQPQHLHHRFIELHLRQFVCLMGRRGVLMILKLSTFNLSFNFLNNSPHNRECEGAVKCQSETFQSWINAGKLDLLSLLWCVMLENPILSYWCLRSDYAKRAFPSDLTVRAVCCAVQCSAVSRARFMTGGRYRLLASANFGELVLGCFEAKVCK